jgi:hypothetical protein
MSINNADFVEKVSIFHFLAVILFQEEQERKSDLLIMVEVNGFEPMAFRVQNGCSTN